MANFELLKQVQGVGPKRYAQILSHLDRLNLTVDGLFQMTQQEIIEQFGLPSHIAAAIVDAVSQRQDSDKNSGQLGELQKKSIQCHVRESLTYPQRLQEVLGEQAPKSLYMWGNQDLLNRPSVGFCGSRSATEKGLAVTADTAQQLAQLGWVIISGHARGVDTTAHRTALENGAGTIIVLPEGILSFKLRQELKAIASPEQILVISEFEPTARWNVGYAMARNKTIIGLSDAMVLVQARMEGGTFAAGQMALKLKVPLFVAQYDQSSDGTAGNDYFIQRGAKVLLKNKETNRANIAYLQEVVERRHHTEKSTEPSQQLGFPFDKDSSSF